MYCTLTIPSQNRIYHKLQLSEIHFQILVFQGISILQKSCKIYFLIKLFLIFHWIKIKMKACFQTDTGFHECFLCFCPVFTGWSSRTSSMQGRDLSLFLSLLRASWRVVLMSDKPLSVSMLERMIAFTL